MYKRILNHEVEIVQHILGSKVVTQDGKYMQTSPDDYFVSKYASIVANAQTQQQKEAIIESAHTIEWLVQDGLKPTDGLMPNNKARAVLGALWPLVELIGKVKGMEEIALAYMGLLVPNPTIPTQEDLDLLSEDLFLP